MRPAQVFATAMAQYASEITVRYNGKNINGKSMISLMAAGIKGGAEVTVACRGADESAMLAEAAAMIENGFGESQ